MYPRYLNIVLTMMDAEILFAVTSLQSCSATCHVPLPSLFSMDSSLLNYFDFAN